jgi:putative DNA primase/helicase
MILAGIGKLGDETVLSRSIVIQMRRKLPHERTERFRPSRIAAEVADVTRKAARWSDDAARAVRDLPEPACPDDMGSRAWDNLEVLARIAAVIGGHWPDRLQVAIAALHGRDGAGSGTTPVHLLFDIVAIVQARAAKRALASWHDIAIRSEELLAELLEFGDG